VWRSSLPTGQIYSDRWIIGKQTVWVIKFCLSPEYGMQAVLILSMMDRCSLNNGAKVRSWDNDAVNEGWFAILYAPVLDGVTIFMWEFLWVRFSLNWVCHLIVEICLAPSYTRL